MMAAVEGTAKRLLGAALVVIGLTANIVGILGNVNSWGASTQVVLVPPPAPGSPSASVSTRPAAGSTSSTTGAGETPTAFLDALAAASRTGDVAFLFGRLNPAVITRYGEAQCRTALLGFTDVTAQFAVKQAAAPAPYNWATEAGTPDARSTIVPDTTTVQVDRVARSQTTATTIHITKVGDRFTWFIDCGTPVGP
jgi:hypothetical protein